MFNDTLPSPMPLPLMLRKVEENDRVIEMDNRTVPFFILEMAPAYPLIS